MMFYSKGENLVESKSRSRTLRGVRTLRGDSPGGLRKEDDKAVVTVDVIPPN